MNKAAKKRLVVVGLVVVVVAVVLFAVLGSGGVATSLSVAQAASGDYDGKKVQVSGVVVQDSYESAGTSAVFRIADADEAGVELEVSYSGSMPATFGNGVTAICTGVVQDGSMTSNEMVTKCPSKYESAEGSLTVATLMASPGTYEGVEVKLAGYVVEGSLAGIDATERFSLTSQGSTVAVAYDGALPDGMDDGSAVVVGGKLVDGVFEATDVALDAGVQSGDA
jgi:cytochrome c-type biogenesis protein CcmE